MVNATASTFCVDTLRQITLGYVIQGQNSGLIPLLSNLHHDRYLIQIKSGIIYERPQIFKNNIKWHYRLVLHGFVEPVDENFNPNTSSMKGDFYIDCESKSYKKDFVLNAKIIQKEIDTNNLSESDLSRYYFYLGQSYCCCERYELSIKNYEKRISYNG